MSKTARLEHVNITVSDAKATAEMLVKTFGWKIRWSGPALDDGYSVHVGGETSYVALYTPGSFGKNTRNSHSEINGLNHVGIVVDDLDAIEQRVIAAGLKPQSHADYEPGRRFYFYDTDGVEFEVISYAPKRKRAGSEFQKMLGTLSEYASQMR